MNGPVQVATDGACKGNPGPGGWAWTTELTDTSAGQQVTTNQEMELRAILEACAPILTRRSSSSPIASTRSTA